MMAGMAASFTMVVSGTIVNVAVPSVIGAFGIGLDQAQLITTGFNIAMVTSQLPVSYTHLTLPTNREV